MKAQQSNISKLKKMIDKQASSEEIVNCISKNINEIDYREVITQKVLSKVFLKDYPEVQKEEIVKELCKAVNIHSRDLYYNWQMVSLLFPKLTEIENDIKEKIKEYFGESLFIFHYCIGMYVYENPETIKLPKNLILSIASNVLNDDLYSTKISDLSLIFEEVYNNRKLIIEYIYEQGIRYGIIYEQYDSVSYMGSKVVKANVLEDKPFIQIAMYDSNIEYGIQTGSLYDEHIRYLKSKEESNMSIYKYYKCKICRYWKLTNQDDYIKQLVEDLLNRQFEAFKTMDMLYLYTEKIPSYICSIITYLYTEMMILIFSSEKIYIVVDKEDIKKNMIFNEHITGEEFEMCISLICYSEKSGKNLYQHRIPFIQREDGIIIGNWMFDCDFSIIEEVKNIALNAKKYNELGKSSDRFGKKTFEKLVKVRFHESGWKVVSVAPNIKKNGEVITDIDLIAFKDGLVILGQIKVANSGREPYQLWKASEVIRKGIKQALLCEKAMENDPNLLYSILKKEEIVIEKEEIKRIVTMVITMNNYFSGIDLESNVIVIGIEVLDEWLTYMREENWHNCIEELINNQFQIHNTEWELHMTTTTLESELFKISYEEFEVAEAYDKN